MRQSIPIDTNIRLISGSYAGKSGTVANPYEYAHRLPVTLDDRTRVTEKRDQLKPGGGFKW